jgi:L-ornithine N5-monooxygenase
VRTPLLDSLYEELYRQRLLQPNPYDWALRLIGNTEVCGVEECAHDLPSSGPENNGRIQLRLKNLQTGQVEMSGDLFDAVVLATGYRRNPFDGILKDLKPLISYAQNQEFDYVQRNYRLRFRPGAVRRDAGVWLQGSCEGTHGVSSTLCLTLSI